MNQHFKRNLSVGFGLSLLILIMSTAASIISINELLRSADEVDHTAMIISNVEKTISKLKDAETGQRGFLLTNEEVFLEPYHGAYDSAMNYLSRVVNATNDADIRDMGRQLKDIINNRIRIMDKLIARRKRGMTVTNDMLREGKVQMDAARALVDKIIAIEKSSLAKRDATLASLKKYARILIVVAAFFAILITVIFYFRVRNDFREREKLEVSLRKSEEETSRRIAIIEDVADKISSGNYAVRITHEKKDSLGSLGDSINHMAESLQFSFGTLSDKEWIQNGLNQLSEKMLGQQNVDELTGKILNFVANYTHCDVGALYLFLNKNELKLISGYALDKDPLRTSVRYGEGIIGQCAKDALPLMVTDIPDGHLSISFASATIKPKCLIAIPILSEGSVTGVMELAALHNFSVNEQTFFKAVSENIGLVIAGAQSRSRTQELLEETQSQAEELKIQHTELEAINAELEIKSEKLQGSEEELKVQQEELMEANKELEERAALLEEKNQVIIETNIQIQSKAEELALSSKYKSEFLANMSHELRTPLNSILLLSGLMSENAEGKLHEEEVEYARVINSSGNGLLSLIDEILDLSRIEAGKMDLQIEDVEISNIVESITDLFVVFARDKQLKFSIEKAPDIPLSIRTDKLRLEQVLKNLLSNAFKFTSKNGSVTLIIGRKNVEELFFTVKDTGIGIPADKQLSIFEAFQQADGSTRRNYGGTGLGLSISRDLARLLGGEITLRSEVDKGSEFRVTIPVRRDEIPEQPEEKITVSPVKMETVTHTNGVVTAEIALQMIPDDRESVQKDDKLILIIEDDTNFAKVLLDFTRQNDYKGIVVVKGDDGLRFARFYKPTAILLDLMLPIKSGWEVLEELKNDPATRHIPVHMMSATDGRRESIVRGAVDFISKPAALEQLKSAFQRIDQVLTRNPKKVLIVEENETHAKALSYYLETSNVRSEIRSNIEDTINALKNDDLDCVLLDMPMPDSKSYDVLEKLNDIPGLEDLPIIIFTGKHFSRSEEARIKSYAESIVVKTAHSYQRILDEVSLFMHVVEENIQTDKSSYSYKKLGLMNEVLKDKSVLVADDDVRNIFSLTKALEKYKMKVYSATDGREVLAKLESTPIDIVLIDMMMPELDGYDTTRLIRSNPKFFALPVLALTAKTMSGDREKCIQAGASDYISKPVDIDQMLSLLRVWLYEKQFAKV